MSSSFHGIGSKPAMSTKPLPQAPAAAAAAAPGGIESMFAQIMNTVQKSVSRTTFSFFKLCFVSRSPPPSGRALATARCCAGTSEGQSPKSADNTLAATPCSETRYRYGRYDATEKHGCRVTSWSERNVLFGETRFPDAPAARYIGLEFCMECGNRVCEKNAVGMCSSVPELLERSDSVGWW